MTNTSFPMLEVFIALVVIEALFLATVAGFRNPKKNPSRAQPERGSSIGCLLTLHLGMILLFGLAALIGWLWRWALTVR